MAGEVWKLYARQDFLTPGAEETLEAVARICPPAASARVLEVAYGKGEAACRLAGQYGCRVLGVDLHPFAAHALERARSRGLSARAAFVRGDGARLPVRDGAFDLALCIGAPSIVGTEPALAAMRRALRPGGWLAVSDWIWRRPPRPEAVPAGYDGPTPALDEYAGLVRAAGFEVVLAWRMPERVWDEYYRPMREAIAEMRARGEDPGGIIEDELRTYDGAGRAYWGYGTFIATRID